jgi:hypothetical protein
MAEPNDNNASNNIAYLMVGVVALAIIIITILTITAIVAGPPVV